MAIQADVSGSTKKTITCEACGHEYEYEMARIAMATSSALLTTREEAAQKATARAVEKLQNKLEKESDVGPCPKCGAITRAMQEAKADDFFKSVLFLLGGLAAVGFVYMTGMKSGRWYTGVGIIGLLACLAGLLGLIMSVATAISEKVSKKRKTIHYV